MSIGASVREEESAQSKADFISKIAIALKECDETGYWLELLVRTGCLANEQTKSYRVIEPLRRLVTTEE